MLKVKKGHMEQDFEILLKRKYDTHKIHTHIHTLSLMVTFHTFSRNILQSQLCSMVQNKYYTQVLITSMYHWEGEKITVQILV